jgi:galactokinase
MKDFATLFGRPAVVTADAPGRVNLIGEHTDYNGGFVLPMPIPQRSRVELAVRDDDTVRAASTNVPGDVQQYRLGEEKPGRGWLDYVQGITRLLRAAGHPVRGFDVRIDSAVPLGSGLSSSAALDVSLLRALRSAFGLEIDDVQIALLGRRVENEFVGAQVGIMDPMAASLGQPGSALFLDTLTLNYERVPLPAAAELVVINSGVAHQHSAGDYNTRRAECERACQLLGAARLRDLTAADLPRLAALPEPLNRRARHVVTENDRVLAAVAALRAGDLARVGELFDASHASQRDDYEVSIPEIDLLVDLSRSDPDVYGARLTGGGFGGSVVLLVRSGRGPAVARNVAAGYAGRSGRTPTVLVPQESGTPSPRRPP